MRFSFFFFNKLKLQTGFLKTSRHSVDRINITRRQLTLLFRKIHCKFKSFLLAPKMEPINCLVSCCSFNDVEPYFPSSLSTQMYKWEPPRSSKNADVGNPELIKHTIQGGVAILLLGGLV